MIELVLIVLFAWRIYHMALEKGLSAWRWVTNFLSGYFAFGILISVALVVVYGKDAFQDINKIQDVLKNWTPFVLLFLVLWFMFLRSRILKQKDVDNDTFNDNDQYFPDLEKEKEPKPEKKDLSYFR